MTIEEITSIFKNRAVLDGNGNPTREGRRAIIALGTALNHGYEIKSRFSVVPDPNTITKYEIWQAPAYSRLRFKHYDWLDTPPKIGEYVPVYAGSIENTDYEGDIKERIFDIFNTEECPEDFHGMSVSVSDVICLIKTDSNIREWWYVDGEGFVELKWEV